MSDDNEPRDDEPLDDDEPRARQFARFQGLMVGTVALMVGVFILLAVVERPGVWQPNIKLDPTPYGYSVGMSIYLVPLIAAAYMLRQLKSFALYQKTLLYAVLGMFVPILLIDILFVGSSFFHFPNCGAYIGYIGAFDLVDWEWEPHSVPIEDVAFYLLAITCTMAVYVWASLFWFPQASPYFRRGRLYEARAWAYIKDWTPHISSLVVGVIFIMGAWGLQRLMIESCVPGQGFDVLERFCLPDSPSSMTCIDGVAIGSEHVDDAPPPLFPIYWTFLVVTAVVPTLVLGRKVGNLVNWPAFSFTFAVMVLISVILAVTTAVPYRWWSFETDVMIGFFFNAWFGIPIEQAFLYLITPWVSVLWLELVHAWRFRALKPSDPLGEGYPVVDLTGGKPPVLPPEDD